MGKARQRLRRARQGLDVQRARQQAKIDARAAAEAAGGRRLPRTRPVPVEQYVRVRHAVARVRDAEEHLARVAALEPSVGKVNTTDPDAAVMPGKRGGFRPRYNVQVLATRGQFVVAITTHPNPNDKQALAPLLERGRANLDTAGIPDPIGTALFDSGYAAEQNFTASLPVEKLLVAVERECRQTGRNTEPVRNKRTGEVTDSTAAASWQVMAVRMREPGNAADYKKRAETVEPVFAQMFARFGRTLSRRTIDAVSTELHLWAAVHNLDKIIRHRVKTGSG